MVVSKNKIKLIKSLESKKGRDKANLFVAEGPKVVGDLLKAGLKAEIILKDEDDVHAVSFLKHPQGVLGVFNIPSYDSDTIDTSSLSLALDGVQDPGNLGTIIRIADWFGITDIFCSQDTADCWNPKVVQATMGSIARVRVHYVDLAKMLDTLPTDFPVYGTLLNGKDIYEEPLSVNGLIIMGNEGKGISPKIEKHISRRLLIPNYPKDRPTADSLNVAIATAITCAEFRRRK